MRFTLVILYKISTLSLLEFLENKIQILPIFESPEIGLELTLN